eukprot:TRINITY_DN2124_c0_g1_i1.p1 TRINITY_DN2124_c0_g1~~TRINITY_DN2124_c0_g1_i1.p1  ORF type:complete len:372 (+),score=149.19 TRINITY_DN2124_c0_g1_i1:42-1157(+)
MSKPNVLVLGGVGFVGRNLVTYIVQNDLAQFVRVVDKVLPATAFLGPPHSEAFANEEIVEYKQCNLTSEAGVNKAYTLDGDREGQKFEIVFNCAAETKYGQTEEVYAEKVLELSKKCAEAAVKYNADKFIEFSTAQVYKADKKASSESGSLKPWTNLAKYKLQAEEALKAIDGLPVIFVRPAICYGLGDVAGVCPRVITAAVYKHLGEKMKFLWSSDLRINTVHVEDVCKAAWHLSQSDDVEIGSIWNLADSSNTSQSSLNSILESIFGIQTGFVGKALSKIASLKLKEATDVVNDKHLKPWSDLCKAHNILNTPLTPYIDQELLYNNSLSIDGSAITGTGFEYDHPNITEDSIRSMIDYFVDQNLFPPLD